MTTESYYDVQVAFESSASDDQFEDFIECVTENMSNIGREVDVTGSSAHREVHFFAATPDLTEESLIRLLTDLQAALHAANRSTPDWPAVHEITATRGVHSRELLPA